MLIKYILLYFTLILGSFIPNGNICASVVEHIVKRNESLMSISNQYYGTYQCWNLILKNNTEIASKNDLEVDQKIIIPKKKLCGKRKKIFNQELTKKEIKKERAQNKSHDGFIVYTSDGKKIKKFLPSTKHKYQFKKKIIEKKERKERKERKVKVKVKTFWLQIASFSTQKEASDLQNDLIEKGIKSFISKAYIKKKKWFRVQLGPFVSSIEAKTYFYAKSLNKWAKNYLVINGHQR